jgi:hypothetical protein
MKATYKQGMRVHSESYEVFTALLTNRVPRAMLKEEVLEAVLAAQALYCPHLQRYFTSEAEMQRGRFEEFGFYPAKMVPESPPSAAALVEFDKQLFAQLPSLLPLPNFHVIRDTAVAELEASLIRHGAVPPATRVALYGSSFNSFGSNGADMDMTLLFPPHVQLCAEDKPLVIERLGAVLTKIGMEDVTTRATARIPIVQFSNPSNGK